MKVCFYSAFPFQTSSLLAIQGHHEFILVNEALSLDNVSLSEGCEVVSIFSTDCADEAVLTCLQQQGTRFIALRSVGFEHVNLKAAQSLGMRVANVPEYSPYAIAEHAVALLLSLNRKIYQSQLLMQMQDFRLDSLIGMDLQGKTVGIIGTGKIGFAFARIMNGFGCRLLGYDPTPNENADAINLVYTEVDDLLAQSDVVALHCPLNEHTHRLLNRERFLSMKKGAVLINTARGGILDTDALIETLETGHLAGAGLDVYDKEKGLFFNDHRETILKDEKFSRLRSFPNVLITGHQAFLTREALAGIASTTQQNIAEWEGSGHSPNDLF
jgi:D-lactate dehydrogenase